MTAVKRILIYRCGNFGDIVCAMPAMTAVRRRFPRAWTGLLTNKGEGGDADPGRILEGNDFLDEIIAYRPGDLGDIRCLCGLVRKIQSLKIDLLVYLPLPRTRLNRLVRDRLFFMLAGCRRALGFRLPRPLKYVCLNDGSRAPVFRQEVERLMSLLTPLGMEKGPVDFRLPIREKDKRYVDQIWEEHKITRGEKVVVVWPGGKYTSKHWDRQNYRRLIIRLQKDYAVRIVLIGGKSEEAAATEIIGKDVPGVVNLAGGTSYMETAEVIRRGHLFVGNDGGALHLSTAVGTPVVGIYSSLDYPGIWSPYGDRHALLRNDDVACRFCMKTECASKECINGITVERVLEACRRYLEPIKPAGL